MRDSPKPVPWADRVGLAWKLFCAARVSLCVSLGLTVVFLFEAQCRDALRVVLENAGEEAPVDATRHILTLLATVGTGSIALWFWGQQPMRLLLGTKARESRPAIWLVRSAAIAPVIAIVITLARMPVDDASLRPLRWVLVMAFAVVAVALYAFFHARREWRQLAFLRTDDSYRWMAWGGGALALVVFLFSLAVREYATLFGPVGVMCLAAAFWTTLLSPLVIHGTRHNIPWLLILAGLGFALGLSNWNDNHEIRHSRTTEDPLTETADVTRTSVIDGFRAWKKTHPDGPIIFVAAEGGGIYAAYHSAYLLARLHETTRHQFGRHVFMLSSVSGGSVGTGLFVSLLAADQRAPAGGMAVRFTPAVRTVLEEDLLSPLLMAAVGPDALQRLLPVSIPWFDRARGLEDALTHRWRAAEADWAAPGDKAPRVDWGTDGNIWDLWLTPDGRGIRTDLPALFINTTLVEAGMCAIIGPYGVPALGYPPPPDLPHLWAGARDLRIPIPTALALSARFPYVTPAGGLSRIRLRPVDQPMPPGAHGKNWRFADAGYYDNTGIDTVLAVLQVLADTKENPAEPSSPSLLPMDRVRVLVINAQDEAERPNGEGLDDLLTPVRALLRVREHRSSLSQINLLARIAQEQYCVSTLRTKSVSRVNESPVAQSQTKPDIPLGWMLSSNSATRIRDQVDDELRALRPRLMRTGGSREQLPAVRLKK